MSHRVLHSGKPQNEPRKNTRKILAIPGVVLECNLSTAWCYLASKTLASQSSLGLLDAPLIASVGRDSPSLPLLAGVTQALCFWRGDQSVWVGAGGQGGAS